MTTRSSTVISQPTTHTHTHSKQCCDDEVIPSSSPPNIPPFTPHIHSNGRLSHCCSSVRSPSNKKHTVNRAAVSPCGVLLDIKGAPPTLISPPRRRRPGNPSSAPAYGSSGSAPPRAACASWFSPSLVVGEP